MPSGFSALFLTTCILSIGFYFYSMAAARSFFSSHPRVHPDFHPPVSILKPMRGLETDIEKNLASFCRQKYPEVEILCGVKDESDPVVGVVRKVMKDFPDKQIRLVLTSSSQGNNPKISQCISLALEAQSSILVVADSDIRVREDYLAQVVAPLADPSVGAVTAMCRSLYIGFVSTLEALRMSTEFCPGVLAAWKMEGGVRFALGSTTVLRRQALEKIGGFSAVKDYLADDYHLGRLIAEKGYSVVLSDHLVEHTPATHRFLDSIRRQVRWMRGIRTSRPRGYAGLIFTYGVPLAIVNIVLSPAWTCAWAALAATLISRWLMVRLIGAQLLDDSAAKNYFWLVPVQDLISFGVWLWSFTGSGIQWRDQEFRLKKGGILAVLPGQ